MEEDVNGELIVDRKKLAYNYLQKWFFIDLISSIPVSFIMLAITAISEEKSRGQSSIFILRFMKLAKMVRLYRILTVFKLVRLFKDHKFMDRAISHMQLSHDVKQALYSFIKMIFLLHFIGCIWGIMAVSEIDDSWVTKAGIQESSVSTMYITSAYWAAVTVSTVGYGDITPTNFNEVVINIFLIFFGVTMYSYIISRLTNIFSSTSQKNDDEEQSKEVVLKNFIHKAGIEINLSSRIMHFFQKNEQNII